MVAYLLGHSLKNQIGVTGVYAKPSPAVVKDVAARLWAVVSEIEE